MKKIIDEDAIVALNIDPTLRAEALSLDDFARLSNLLEEYPEACDKLSRDNSPHSIV